MMTLASSRGKEDLVLGMKWEIRWVVNPSHPLGSRRPKVRFRLTH